MQLFPLFTYWDKRLQWHEIVWNYLDSLSAAPTYNRPKLQYEAFSFTLPIPLSHTRLNKSRLSLSQSNLRNMWSPTHLELSHATDVICSDHRYFKLMWHWQNCKVVKVLQGNSSDAWLSLMLLLLCTGAVLAKLNSLPCLEHTHRVRHTNTNIDNDTDGSLTIIFLYILIFTSNMPVNVKCWHAVFGVLQEN